MAPTPHASGSLPRPSPLAQPPRRAGGAHPSDVVRPMFEAEVSRLVDLARREGGAVGIREGMPRLANVARFRVERAVERGEEELRKEVRKLERAADGFRR